MPVDCGEGVVDIPDGLPNSIARCRIISSGTGIKQKKCGTYLSGLKMSQLLTQISIWQDNEQEIDTSSDVASVIKVCVRFCVI